MNKDSTLKPNAQCKVSDFMKDKNTWDVDKLRQMINNEIVVQKVLGIPLPQFNTEDSFC